MWVGTWLVNFTTECVGGDYVHFIVHWVGWWMHGWVVYLVGRLITVMLVMSRSACWVGVFI